MQVFFGLMRVPTTDSERPLQMIGSLSGAAATVAGAVCAAATNAIIVNIACHSVRLKRHELLQLAMQIPLVNQRASSAEQPSFNDRRQSTSDRSAPLARRIHKSADNAAYRLNFA